MGGGVGLLTLGGARGMGTGGVEHCRGISLSRLLRGCVGAGWRGREGALGACELAFVGA